MTRKEQESAKGETTIKRKGGRKSAIDYGKAIEKPDFGKGWQTAPNDDEFFKFDQIGVELTGEFIEIRESTKKNYSDNLVVKLENGNIVLTPFTASLKKAWSRVDIPVGSIIKIVLYDVVALKGGNTYKKFAVAWKEG